MRTGSALLLVSLACGGERDERVHVFVPPPTPQEHLEGEALFNQSCSGCHGMVGSGTTQGPPLVHQIYEPNHHSDPAFYLAVERGVRAHHWGFGDMQPMPGVDRDHVALMIGYMRWLQREAGIY